MNPCMMPECLNTTDTVFCPSCEEALKESSE